MDTVVSRPPAAQAVAGARPDKSARKVITLQRAHRRDHQRLRRGRAALRPVAGRDRRADGQRHLDHGDHPGRDPAAGAQRRRRQRQSHPHRRRAGHQRRRRDRPGGGVQRAGAARPRARERAQARLHHPAREHVAPQRGSRRSPRPTSRPTTSSWPPATRCYEIPMEQECRTLVADARRGKNMFALGMLCQLYSLDLQLARDQIVLDLRQEGRRVVDTNIMLLDAGHAWAEANLDFSYRIPAVRVDRAADRRQRQHGAGARRARVGDGNLRDVPDHAGDLGVALPVATCSRRSAASCTRPRTRSRPARSRSAPPTPASARSRSPPAPAIRSSRRRSASR